MKIVNTNELHRKIMIYEMKCGFYCQVSTQLRKKKISVQVYSCRIAIVEIR